jgi:coenzyme F420-0:L-glutamate ligase/coenzyme F420-1:gamma-L-glutamate ligase
MIPLPGIPEVDTGADLVELIAGALDAQAIALQEHDIVVVASKIVSKAEGRRVTDDPVPSPRALELAAVTGFPPAEVELILSQSTAVLRSAAGVLVTETPQGFVCANAGVDRSNVGQERGALLLPLDPDASARNLRDSLSRRWHIDVAVLISDTFGRPFRHGLVNVALGVAGMDAIRDYRGQVDAGGRRLRGTEIAIADELCSAAELVMNKLDRVPVAVIRGYLFDAAGGGVAPLLRDPAHDYFR